MKATAFWIHHILHFDTQFPNPADVFHPMDSLRTAGSWLSQHLCHADEPRVWKTSDRSGQVHWHVYDPLTNRYAAFDSEDETRVWLEERYNQPTPEVTLTVLR